ncbi:MAG: hypothetical protein J6V49_07630 [Bacteroidales bacterium]|nr:hypothetical protein [Bacteroidales bacterium]
MKKRFNLYIVAWAALLALFNVIAFVSVGWEGQDKYTPSFWIGYAFITIMFIGQLVCTYMAFKADTAQKLFYNISLIRTSYAGLITSFVVGGLCMLISPLQGWVGAILCSIILAANILSVVKATIAVGEVVRIDEKVKVQTFFIKSLTVDADTLMAMAKSDSAKAECKKVYEAIRYSDPMSNDALASVESQITVKFAALSDAVKADETDKVAELANEVCILVGDRNKKCKLLK